MGGKIEEWEGGGERGWGEGRGMGGRRVGGGERGRVGGRNGK